MLVVVGPLASLGIYILKVWPKPGKRRAEEQEEGEESGETFWRKRCEEEEKRSQGLKAALEESESKLEQEQSERKRAEDERDTEKKDREAVQAFLEEAKQQQESLNQRLKLLGDAKGWVLARSLGFSLARQDDDALLGVKCNCREN